MTIYVDIDETICITDNSRDYSKSIPIKENIDKINKLYKDGHKIIYWTARGSQTGKDWTKITKNQLVHWGALHHELKTGKPAYDLFIDDKSIRIEEIISGIRY